MTIFTGGDYTLKKNFRPISELSTISKVLESFMSKQICLFAYRLHSNLLCVFREGHNAEHALFRLTEICRKAPVDGRIVRIMLMDLPKAYGTLHDLLIAKRAVYGFGHSTLLLIQSYISNGEQRVTVGSEFSERLEMKSGDYVNEEFT